MEIEYPFENFNNFPIENINISNIPFPIPKDSYNNLFPQVVSSQCVFHCSCDNKNWNTMMSNLFIYCDENKIPLCIVFWDLNNWFTYNFANYNWKNSIPKPEMWNPQEKYPIGIHAPINKNLKYTLETLSPFLPYQVFITNPKSWEIGKIKPENIPCHSIIKEKEMTIFAHMPYIYNIARENLSEKIRQYLEYGTQLGICGCVIHVGKQVNLSENEAYLNMKNNILNALKDSNGICPLILETCASQGTEMLFKYDKFCSFVLEILAENTNFGICIDSCHVFACGYAPDEYLKYCLSLNLPVKLIHYNDSLLSWKSRKDRHTFVGQGKIPWIMMENLAKLAFEKLT
jgi:endonuclease IV